jgi:putative transposase
MTESPRILFRTILRVAHHLVSFLSLVFRSRAQLAAENLFLRKQLALFLQRWVKPRHADVVGAAHRMATATDNREAGHAHSLASKGVCFGAGNQARQGGPPIAADLRLLIATMATVNRTWGEERIAASFSSSLAFASRRESSDGTCNSKPPRGPTGTGAEHVYPKSRIGRPCVRLVPDCDRNVPGDVSVRSLGGRHVTNLVLERTAHATAEWTALW